MSPHRLYAQLELGKGPQPAHVHWGAFDPRAQISPAMMPERASGASSFRTGTASSGPSRSGSLNLNVPNVTAPPHPTGLSLESAGPAEPTSPLPPFMPFSPPMPQTTLRPLNGEPASYISPSTLLSPPSAPKDLRAVGGAGIEGLTRDFGKMGVKPPGQGPENEAKEHAKEAKGTS